MLSDWAGAASFPLSGEVEGTGSGVRSEENGCLVWPLSPSPTNEMILSFDFRKDQMTEQEVLMFL